MTVKPYSFKYSKDIDRVLEPWRSELNDDYEAVVTLLRERDREVEQHLSRDVAQGVISFASPTVQTIVPHASGFVQITDLTCVVNLPSPRSLEVTLVASIDRNNAGDAATLIEVRVNGVFQVGISRGITAHDLPASINEVIFMELPAGQHTITIWADSVAQGAGTSTQTTWLPTAGYSRMYLSVSDIGPADRI